MIQDFKEVHIDVSDLEAPGPLTEILKTLNVLAAQTKLIVRHRQEPKGLFPILKEKNYSYEIQQDGAHFYITIWKNFCNQNSPGG